MKREDLYRFQEGLMMVTLSGAKFTYAVTKNKRLVEQEIKDMERAKKPAPDFEAYMKEDRKLSEEFAEKDPTGKPMTRREKIGLVKFIEKYVIKGSDDPESDYHKRLKELKEKHKEAIEIQEKQEEEYREFLKEDTEWKPFMIDLDIVPDTINQYVMDGIHWMIKDVEKL